MRIKVGYELVYEQPQPTPMLLMLTIHPSRADDIQLVDFIDCKPVVPISYYRDSFGNTCGRIVAPAGRLPLSATPGVRDTGVPAAVRAACSRADVGAARPAARVFLGVGSGACRGGGWSGFAARHNVPRIGRILVARGRDASDVALTTSFGPTTLTGFKVVADEIVG